MKFKPLGENPWTPVVAPDGEIMHVRYSQNVSGGIVRLEGGRPRLTPEYQDKGYRFLADYYREDEDEELRADGFKVYMDHQAAIDAGKAPREMVEGNTREVFARLPVDWLPSAVADMQIGRLKPQWAPPERKKKAAKSRAKPAA